MVICLATLPVARVASSSPAVLGRMAMHVYSTVYHFMCSESIVCRVFTAGGPLPPRIHARRLAFGHCRRCRVIDVKSLDKGALSVRDARLLFLSAGYVVDDDIVVLHSAFTAPVSVLRLRACGLLPSSVTSGRIGTGHRLPVGSLLANND